MKTRLVGWAVLGGLGWTASEYVIHRYVGHGKRRKPPERLIERLTPMGFLAAFNAEHLAHHADPTYFAPTVQKVAAASLIVPLFTAALTPVLGLGRSISFAVGFSAVYGAYEIAHRRLHTHEPRTAYGRWMQTNHLEHHRRTPRANFGVTSGLWDLAFGTHRPPKSAKATTRIKPASEGATPSAS